MALGYVWEKLFSAVSSLASGTDRLQKRLEYAMDSLYRLKPEDFASLPPEYAKAFIDIKTTLTATPANSPW
jgi:hypothetical protein